MSFAERLLGTIKATSSVTEAHRLLRKDEEINIKGAVGALKSFFLASLFNSFSTQVVYISVGLDEVEAVKEELETLVNPSEVAFFPSLVKHQYRFHGSDTNANSVRLSALESIVKQKPGIIVLNARALLYRLPAHASYLKEKVSLNVNDEFEFEELVARLINLGFKRELRVERSGEMSVQPALKIENAHVYDLILVRAVAKLHRVYEFALPFLRPEGKLLAVKGSGLEDELALLRTCRPGVTISVEPHPICLNGRQSKLRLVTVESMDAYST